MILGLYWARDALIIGLAYRHLGGGRGCRLRPHLVRPTHRAPPSTGALRGGDCLRHAASVYGLCGRFPAVHLRSCRGRRGDGQLRHLLGAVRAGWGATDVPTMLPPIPCAVPYPMACSDYFVCHMRGGCVNTRVGRRMHLELQPSFPE